LLSRIANALSHTHTHTHTRTHTEIRLLIFEGRQVIYSRQLCEKASLSTLKCEIFPRLEWQCCFPEQMRVRGA